jgi:DNA polymerase III alpha subunit (gram-positive type)
MPGLPIYLESDEQNVAALNVTNFAISGSPLIYGYNPQRNMVFQVFNTGEVWAARNIYSSNDVYARGVMFTCDKNAKENFSSINTLEILDNLASMPIQSWRYKDDTSDERHIGPTAQDFHAAFGLNNETRISSADLHGVTLAAIQGLNEKNEMLKAENAQLHAKLSNLEARLSALESKG